MRGSVDSAEVSRLLVYSRRARLFARCLERTRSSRAAWDARRSVEEESTSAVLILVNVSCKVARRERMCTRHMTLTTRKDNEKNRDDFKKLYFIFVQQFSLFLS